MVQQQELTVFLASPSADTLDAREAVAEAVKAINIDPGYALRVRLKLLRWDDPDRTLALSAETNAQVDVIEQVCNPARCDLRIGLLRHRMGGKLPPEPPGSCGAGRCGSLAARHPGAGFHRRQRHRRLHCGHPAALPVGLLERLPNVTETDRDGLSGLAKMSEADVEALLEERCRCRTQRQPAAWESPHFNHPAQPVVGVTVFEAQAQALALGAAAGS